LPDSPAAADAALMVSELFTNAVLYSTSGHPGGTVTVSIALGRGKARIHVIDQGGYLELSQAAPSVATAVAEAPHLGVGLTIVRELADEFATEGPDKCFTLRVAGPARPSLPDGPGGNGAGARAGAAA
jgi:anti-sigma regulatory factor (Ser/Thr protein kinase)